MENHNSLQLSNIHVGDEVGEHVDESDSPNSPRSPPFRGNPNLKRTTWRTFSQSYCQRTTGRMRHFARCGRK